MIVYDKQIFYESKKLRLNKNGEPFIEVVDTESLCLIAAMNFENQHSIEKDVPLVDIHRVVLGDLLEPGQTGPLYHQSWRHTWGTSSLDYAKVFIK